MNQVIGKRPGLEFHVSAKHLMQYIQCLVVNFEWAFLGLVRIKFYKLEIDMVYDFMWIKYFENWFMELILF